jgi:hypothetical protein
MVKKKKKSLTKFYRQTGSSKKKSDDARSAKKPGWRVSESGKLYFENRKNRSDSKKEISQYKRQKKGRVKKKKK